MSHDENNNQVLGMPTLQEFKILKIEFASLGMKCIQCLNDDEGINEEGVDHWFYEQSYNQCSFAPPGKKKWLKPCCNKNKSNPKFKVWSTKKKKIIESVKFCSKKYEDKLNQHIATKKAKLKLFEQIVSLVETQTSKNSHFAFLI